MKGKGKGDRTSGAKDKQQAAECNDLKDCPLSFPDLTPVDHVQLCPRFTSSKCLSHDGNFLLKQVFILILIISAVLDYINNCAVNKFAPL